MISDFLSEIKTILYPLLAIPKIAAVASDEGLPDQGESIIMANGNIIIAASLYILT